MMEEVVSEEEKTKLIEILNKILKLEYSLIIFYPRLASMIKDEEAKVLTQQLGTDSVQHADTDATVIRQLGGNPNWTFQVFPLDLDLITIFDTQLQKEKEAKELYQLASSLTSDSSIKRRFSDIIKHEDHHIELIKKILSRLN
jgi:bacterioferritin